MPIRCRVALTRRIASPPPASSGVLRPEGQFLFSWAAAALCWLIGYPPYTAEPRAFGPLDPRPHRLPPSP